jgi:ribonucleoside-diphosphate reductase alpha chain
MINLSQSSKIVLERRYLQKDPENSKRIIETPEELFRRVADYVASADKTSAEETSQAFYDMMTSFDFLPNSPTLMNAGASSKPILAACFVLPIEDDMWSIAMGLAYMMMIQKAGGGTGFSFSRLRPEGDIIASTGGTSSGPISFMRGFDAVTDFVKQGGKRRGANMGILRVDHPDVLKFITCKSEEGTISNFNISVAITDKFMEALSEGETYELINPRNGEVVDRIPARTVWDALVEASWKNGEPGVVYIDRINEANTIPEFGDIEATNPCGEQPLLPYESCVLGSINLSNMVVTQYNGEFEQCINVKRLIKVAKNAVKFLDNVIDVAHYPVEEIREITQANRKIGLGVMGFADALCKMGIRYDSDLALEAVDFFMSIISQAAREESAVLAEEWGVPMNLTEHDALGRNATLTTIAPTGSISIIANCSSGIEPLFGLVYRRKNILDKDELYEVNPVFEKILRERGLYSEELVKQVDKNGGSLLGIDGIPDDLENVFRISREIPWDWHIKIQAQFQGWVDNAVSKTINFPYTAERADISKAYKLAFRTGCKGLTVYREGSRQEEVLVTGQRQNGRNGNGHKAVVRDAPDDLHARRIKIKTDKGNAYAIVSFDEHNNPLEIFMKTHTTFESEQDAEAITRLASLCLRAGIPAIQVIQQLEKANRRGGSIMSVPAQVQKALEKTIGPWVSEDRCPECQSLVRRESGCISCDCGYVNKCG